MTRVHRQFSVCVACILAIAWLSPGWGEQGTERAHLWITLDARGQAEVDFTVEFVPTGEQVTLIRAGLEQAMGCSLTEVVEETEDGEWWLMAECHGAFARRWLVTEGEIHLAPVARLAAQLDVDEVLGGLYHPPVVYTRCEGAQPGRQASAREVEYTFDVAPTGETGPVHLTYGYRGVDLAGVFMPLMIVLLVPLAVVVWLRRAALATGAADPTMAWFRYVRALQATTVGTWLVWLGVLLAVDADALWRFAVSEDMAAGLSGGFLFFLVGPAVVTVTCSVLSHPVYRRVRGMEWTPCDLAMQTALRLALQLAPIGCFMAAVDAFVDRAYLSMVLLVAGAFVSRLAFAWWWSKAADMSPHAVTVGELRDRAFALAGKAGVKIQQLYVLPAGKARMANAFAAVGNNVLLTDYLLEHLTRGEVDSVIVHELAHLKQRHLLVLRIAVIAVIAFPIVVMATSKGSGLDADRWQALLFPAALALGLQGLRFLQRRLERSADARAARLTGDPESLVSGLTKLASANLMPLQWGRLDEQLLTHPSTRRRAEAIARRAGVPVERIDAILRDEPDEGDRYSVPTAGEDTVFSSTRKAGMTIRNFVVLVTVATVTPAAIAAVARAASLHGLSWWLAYVGGLAATVALFLCVLNYVSVWGYDGLQEKLGAKIRAAGCDMAVENGKFIGFAPSGVPRLHEGFYDWDLGFLLLTCDHLCYLGEQARFAIPKEDVTGVCMGPRHPGPFRTRRVNVTWRGKEGSWTFSLRPAPVRSLRESRRCTCALSEELLAWKTSEEAGVQSSPPGDLPLPTIGEVSSLSPRELGSGKMLWTYFKQWTLAAVVVAALFRLPFDPAKDGAAWYVILVTWFVALINWAPFRRYKGPATSLESPPPQNGQKVTEQ